MRKFSSIIWGLIVVALGVLLALRAFDVVHFEIFFDGWWTLFIIVPCFVNLISGKEIWGNLIGIGIGAVLLLTQQDVLKWNTIGKLILPVVLVLIGIRLIFGNVSKRKMFMAVDRVKQNGGNVPEYCATFSGQNLNFSGQNFSGVKLTAVFGGIKCDLRGAVIENEAVIDVSSVFGGVDIFLPDEVNVKTYSNSIFGGVDNKRKAPPVEGAPTVYINASCVFGGADIR